MHVVIISNFIFISRINPGTGDDKADPFPLAHRATTYEYMESVGYRLNRLLMLQIPRAIMDYTHVSGYNHVLEWDHVRGKDAWRGFK